MLNDWSHKVRPILKEYCPGNIQKILPSSQSAWNTRFYFGHQKLCMDNNNNYNYNNDIGWLFFGGYNNISLDANNITLAFNSGNIVNISGNIFLYPPQGHPKLYHYAQWSIL